MFFFLKMFNFVKHHRSANLHHNEILPHTFQIGYNQKTTSNKSGEDVEKKEPYTVLVGMQISAATVEIRMEVSQKT